KLHGTRLEAGKVRGIMSEAAGSPELTVVDAIDTNLDLFLHRLRYRRHHMACDFTTIDHLGVGKPRGHVLPSFGRRKPTNMRGPDTRRTLLHARSSSKIVRRSYLGRRTCAGSWVGMPRIIMNRGFIGRWTRMPHSIGPLSASASLHHSLSSAAFINNIAESDFRHAQVVTLNASVAYRWEGTLAESRSQPRAGSGLRLNA